jgi:hypothetical protein
MELYANIKIMYPNAKISVAAHSNGTYIVSNAIVKCKSIVFDKIYFAGSVIRRDFDWKNAKHQVDCVINYAHGGDYVVALFPAIIEILGLKFMNLGGAGYFGFRNAMNADVMMCSSDQKSLIPNPAVYNYFVCNGGHSAGVDEAAWDIITNYFVINDFPKPEIKSDKIRHEIAKRYAKLFFILFIIIILISALSHYLLLLRGNGFDVLVNIILFLIALLFWRFIKSC